MVWLSLYSLRIANDIGASFVLYFLSLHCSNVYYRNLMHDPCLKGKTNWNNSNFGI